jgi:hypothetical protein
MYIWYEKRGNSVSYVGNSCRVAYLPFGYCCERIYNYTIEKEHQNTRQSDLYSYINQIGSCFDDLSITYRI